MARLKWDTVGERFFEAGVDRGVLYPSKDVGIAWNGLVGVSESPSGGEASPYYYDGVKYLNVSSPEEFSGTIEAYTYPDEFAPCLGISEFEGLGIHQQRKQEFSFSYRTLLGNDIKGVSHGYKIHLVYNALASSSQNTYSSMSDDTEALTFTWKFSTRPDPNVPVSVNDALLGGQDAVKSFNKSGLSAFSHVTLDSTKTPVALMWMVENLIYGTEDSGPTLPTLQELFVLYENPPYVKEIKEQVSTGMASLSDTIFENGDLIGPPTTGLYSSWPTSSLVKTDYPGLYILED